MNPITKKSSTLTLISALVAQLAAPAAMARHVPSVDPGIREKVTYLTRPSRDGWLDGDTPKEKARAEAEFAAKLRRLNQQKDSLERRERTASRRAAFRTFRNAIRLKGPDGLRAFRDRSVSWGQQGQAVSEARPTGNNEWERWYDDVEARARVNALEAVIAVRKAGYHEAKRKALAIAREYRNELSKEERTPWIQAFLAARKKGLNFIDARKVAHESVAQAKEAIEKKVAAKLAEAEAAELAKLEERALEAGYEAYAEEEEQAFATAGEVMDEHTMDPDEGVDEEDRMSFEERQAWDQEQYEASQEQLRITRLQREGALLYGVPVYWGAE